jgi:hypothetical protein
MRGDRDVYGLMGACLMLSLLLLLYFAANGLVFDGTIETASAMTPRGR